MPAPINIGNRVFWHTMSAGDAATDFTLSITNVPSGTLVSDAASVGNYGKPPMQQAKISATKEVTAALAMLRKS